MASNRYSAYERKIRDEFEAEVARTTPPGYTDEEWREHKEQTAAAIRGEIPCPPPVRIHLPDGRLQYTMVYVDGQWEVVAPPVPVKEPRAPRAVPEDACIVYFIAGDSGPVKIGVAADPAVRLKTLQTANPVRLSILATAKGGSQKEAAYHRRFAAHRLHGEWFERVPEILDEIERLNPLSVANRAKTATKVCGSPDHGG